jgi:guanylate kinase
LSTAGKLPAGTDDRRPSVVGGTRLTASRPDSSQILVEKPSERREPCLVLIGGRSGCGKTTLVDVLVTKFPSVYARVRSFTSRARRPDEGDAEYRFVTREALHRMDQRGELVSLDEAYGENYGMSREAIETILAGGRFAVKEMHAKNHTTARSAMPRTISALLQLADDRWNDERKDLDPARAQRLAEDRHYYATLDPARFNVVHRIDVGETPSMTADALHAKLQTFVAGRRTAPGV